MTLEVSLFSPRVDSVQVCHVPLYGHLRVPILRNVPVVEPDESVYTREPRP